ncbi:MULTISPECIES: hypothetical protein [unclassified Streptomyces]|uniref:hypothetical protein n=1 Tax=unclassified Streptomyces TaxID=2593676 RepID=UPI00081DDBBC|nr:MULTISPECIES: hypothetical protein [unclassified Streptomyces]MYZ35453.1 hypothetical protein [Streptomyces sp. SID4917]SCF75604.1 hypothetical protein GA0115259_102103 [Streptomyces sp. MnatMP-M17]
MYGPENMAGTADTTELLTRGAQGDSAAFTELAGRHRARLLGLCRLITCDNVRPDPRVARGVVTGGVMSVVFVAGPAVVLLGLALALVVPGAVGRVRLLQLMDEIARFERPYRRVQRRARRLAGTLGSGGRLFARTLEALAPEARRARSSRSCSRICSRFSRLL